MGRGQERVEGRTLPSARSWFYDRNPECRYHYECREEFAFPKGRAVSSSASGTGCSFVDSNTIAQTSPSGRPRPYEPRRSCRPRVRRALRSELVEIGDRGCGLEGHEHARDDRGDPRAKALV